MRLIDAYEKIIQLNVPAFQTRDIAAYLDIKSDHASKILNRLSVSGQLIKLAHGRWAVPGKVDLLQLPEILTAPFPSYISLQTALYHHGIISQIPAIIYAVSLARTRQYKTPLGSVSIHHIQPDFFCGYEVVDKTDIKMATPEKALIDVFYLHQAKSQIFAALPEVELPDDFDIKKVRAFIKKIPYQKRRVTVERLFEELIQK